jgi:deoxycytidylate deaminase
MLEENLITEAARNSTCLKRAVVCVLYNEDGRLLACASNRCTPPEGGCPRIGLVQSKSGYTGTECVCEHAEARALQAVQPWHKPSRAIVIGHEFACKPCEAILAAAGVNHIQIIPSGYGTGVKTA